MMKCPLEKVKGNSDNNQKLKNKPMHATAPTSPLIHFASFRPCELLLATVLWALGAPVVVCDPVAVAEELAPDVAEVEPDAAVELAEAVVLGDAVRPATL
jgi:hypothetical protein